MVADVFGGTDDSGRRRGELFVGRAVGEDDDLVKCPWSTGTAEFGG